MKCRGRTTAQIVVGAMFLLLPSCSLDQMATGSKIRPFAESSVFADSRSARLPVPGTVARGHLDDDDLLYRGEIDGRVADRFPFSLTRADLARGRERFDIHCSPCHGRTGLGDGMIVQRGFTAPPSYFSTRLRRASVGHFFQVISNGFGAMASYGDQVGVRDRWRIAAYIRALQLSRDVKLTDLPEAVRDQLLTMPIERPRLNPEERMR